VADDQSAAKPGDQDAKRDPDSDATAPMAASELNDDAPDPDATRLIRPADPDATHVAKPAATSGAVGGDTTELIKPDDDATALIKPDDATALIKSDDATTVLPPTPIDPAAPPTTVLRSKVPDSTSVMPPASEPARWSAKANVPRAVPRDPDATAQWSPPEPRRAWWLPILLAVIGLLVLLGIVYFLITSLNNNDQPSGPSKPVPTPSVVQSSVSPSTPASSAPPTSASPTQPGAPYVIPGALIGLPIAEAESILDDNHVAHTAVAQVDTTHIPNTVVQTSPSPGQTVPVGGIVTLYYAQPAVTTPSTPPTPTPSAS
jgi:hypothetical protein